MTTVWNIILAYLLTAVIVSGMFVCGWLVWRTLNRR